MKTTAEWIQRKKTLRLIHLWTLFTWFVMTAIVIRKSVAFHFRIHYHDNRFMLKKAVIVAGAAWCPHQQHQQPTRFFVSSSSIGDVPKQNVVKVSVDGTTNVSSLSSSMTRLNGDDSVPPLRSPSGGDVKEYSTNDGFSEARNEESALRPPQASISSSPAQQFRIIKQLRTGLAVLVAGTGFISSVASSALGFTSKVATNNQRQWKLPVEALRRFLESSGIDLELSQALLNRRLLKNTVLLARIQKAIREREEKESFEKESNVSNVVDNIVQESNDVYLRYMRYATAAYGKSMIRAAELDVSGTISNPQFLWEQTDATRLQISKHIGIPVDDIIVLEVDYGGDVDRLRHIVAVDHVHQEVVLAIRGTFSLEEIVVDAVAFSRPFCGGEAHSEIASMAERVWDAVGVTILRLLDENPNYKLILTGHSLGAGTACLLNILCHQERRALVKGRSVRCLAFASPPVFTPIDLVPLAADNCINFIHELDVVPFLSVHSVRHIIACLRAVEEHEVNSHMKEGGLWGRLSNVFRSETTTQDGNDSLEDTVKRVNMQQLPGAPILFIPASTNFWLRENKMNRDTYNMKAWDSPKLAKLGVFLNLNMMLDHMPPRYEHALTHIQSQSRSISTTDSSDS